MPVTRDSLPIQGDVPGSDPARAPPDKAIAQAELTCRGRPAGVCLAGQGPPRGAPLPYERRVPGSRLGHAPPEPSGSQRSLAVRCSPGRRYDPGETRPMAKPC
jgi:hypothetical protein